MKTDPIHLLRCSLLCGSLAAGAAWPYEGDRSFQPVAPAEQGSPSLQGGPEKMQQDKPSKKSTRQIPSRQTADPQQRPDDAPETDARHSKGGPDSAAGAAGRGGMQGPGAPSGSH